MFISLVLSCSKDTIIYTLTTSANPSDGGTVSPALKDYEEGETVTINASPAAEYVFQNWSGASGTSETTSILMNSNKTVVANFIKKQYALTINVEGEGTVNEKIIKVGSSTDYNSGTIVELNALPLTGYRFENWAGDLTGSENPKQITIDKAKSVTAVFVEQSKSPIKYGKNEFWGKIVNFDHDVFFAEDVSQLQRESFLSTLQITLKYYENYGPTEWWIIGDDTSAAEKLAVTFADYRNERNQLYNNDYNYTKERANNYFQSYVGVTNAGVNGDRNFGFHLVMFSGKLLRGGNDNEDYLKNNKHLTIDTVTHEYTHVVQSANLFNEEIDNNRPDGENKRVGWGPIFFVEGSAVYYAEYIPRKLIQNGENIEWGNLSTGLQTKMTSFMDDIQKNINLCPDFNIWDVNYSTRETCSPYIFGAWGVAYLLHKVDDQDKFWKSFWPTIDEKGWDSAFEDSFGITMDQFNKEFLEFLKLPIEKQLEIIPNI